MKSAARSSLPLQVNRGLRKLGGDLANARRKRNLTALMMAERIGVAKATYLKIEKGSATVSIGFYAMAIFVLGFGNALADLADARGDDAGLLLDAERLPKRVRPKKQSTPL